MKVTIEVDCTPEEARRMMGLPDLTPLHDSYLKKMQDAVDGGTVAPEMLGNLVKSWAPVGDVGVEFWRKLLANGAKPGA